MTNSNAQNVKVILEIPTHFTRVSSSDDLKPSAETKDFKIKLQEVNEKVQQHRTAQIINPIFSSMYLCIFGLTSCYGIVLKTHNMSERDWDVDDEEVEYWAKATFFPLVPLTYLAGGVLIDRIGSIKTYRIMLTLVTFGLLLETYLANLNNFVGYMAGKVIISAFHGTMIVSQATLIAKWSRDTDEFSTRVGFIFYMGSTGSAIGPLFFGWLSKSVDETFIFTCLIPSLIVGLFAIGLQATFVDKKGETFEEHLRGTILLTRPEFESLKGTKTLFCLFALAYILINPGSNLAALNFDWTILRAAEFDQFLPTAIFVVVGVVSGGWVRAFGRMIHNKGKRINLMIVTGLVVLLLNSTLFKLRDPTPYPLNLGVWIIAIGVVFWRAMQAVVYQPLVALLIKPKFLGTAYGILFFFIETLNIQLTNWKESVLTKDNTAVDATYWLQTCAICLIVSSIAVTAVLLVVDLKKGGKLNCTGATFVDQKKFIEDLDIPNLEVSTDASPEAMISYPKNDKDVVASNLKNTGDCLVNSNSNNNSALNEPRVRRSKSHFG